MNEIEKQFKERAIIRGETLLFSKDNALSFVEACKKNGIGILGIDSFFLFDDSIQPSMENSIDFSSLNYVIKSQDIYSEAKNFLSERNETMFFEIICSE
ncbi:hypothetical protein HRH25_23665 [Flavisolibacter sp. BT320]|nr:hypothetical protein [Flavisolibacter longurius]